MPSLSILVSLLPESLVDRAIKVYHFSTSFSLEELVLPIVDVTIGVKQLSHGTHHILIDHAFKDVSICE